MNDDQTTDVDLLFADIIQINPAMTFTTIRNLMRESMHLMEHVQDIRMVSTVYKRVKYLKSRSFQRNLKDVFPFDAEEDDENSNVGSITQTSTGQVSSTSKPQTWSTSDSKL